MLTKAETGASGDETAHPTEPAIDVARSGEATVYTLGGDWTTRHAGTIDRTLADIKPPHDGTPIRLDMTAIRRMDTAGALLIKRLEIALEKRGAKLELVGQSEVASILLAAVDEAARQDVQKPKARSFFDPIRFFETVGHGVYRIVADLGRAMDILGSTIQGAQQKIGKGGSVNPHAIVAQIDKMGVGAIPVVLLMSSIVGAIVAQQGAFQLRYFGAEIFVVDLVGILVLREMGVLLTAIMIAGRSGSAITAEIGSMKMREEIDALKVIGLNPVGVLVFPRLVALVIALPCLTILANFAAIGGAMIITWVYSGIPPEAFIDRMRDTIDLSTFLSGLIKAPFMAMIIGVIASVEGMKVGGSAESLGKQVTSSVVKSIFVVVVVDGLFAMFFAAIDF